MKITKRQLRQLIEQTQQGQQLDLSREASKTFAGASSADAWRSQASAGSDIGSRHHTPWDEAGDLIFKAVQLIVDYAGDGAADTDQEALETIRSEIMKIVDTELDGYWHENSAGYAAENDMM